MARITVEDCLEKIDSQYDLVLLAKERTSQLNAGEKSLVTEDNDKNTVISLREIGGGKIPIKNIEDAAINKLRKIQPQTAELEELDADDDDDFDKIYKGEISKSGAAILPSKRVRRIPEKLASDLKNEENLTEELKVEDKLEEEIESKEDQIEKETESKEKTPV